MEIILDVGICIVMFLSIFVCYRRGFLRSVFGLLSNILAIIISSWLGSFLSNLIYDNFIRDKVVDSVSESIAGAVGSQTQSVETAANNLPDYVNTILGLFGYTTDSLNSGINNAVETQSLNIAQAVESVIAPIIMAIMTIILVIILFIIIRIIFGKLIKLADIVSRAPVIRTVNKIFGGLLGIVNGFIIVYFITAVVSALIPLITGGNITYEEFAEVSGQTIIFDFFYKNNIITNIIMS